MKWFLAVLIFLLPSLAHGRAYDWALKLCKEQPDLYACEKIKVPDKPHYVEWNRLTPVPRLNDWLIAINRRNTYIWHNHTIAIPRVGYQMRGECSPFPLYSTPNNHIVVDLKNLAWGAYLNGILMKWGPANGGSKRCKETKKLQCKTPPGTWSIIKMYNVNKKSDLYPVDCKDKKKCGHPMPYYMQFHRDGTGLHGDKWLVGRNASHGCVRMLKEDARWLNQEFAYVGMKVVILDY